MVGFVILQLLYSRIIGKRKRPPGSLLTCHIIPFCGDYFRLLIFFQGTTKTKNVTILAKPMTPQTLTTAMRQGSHLTGAASLTRSGFWTSQNAIVIDSDASPL